MSARLHAIVDVDTCNRTGWTPAAAARAFLDGGARVLQVRAKALPSAAFLVLCDDIVAMAAERRAEVIVNDRADLARLSLASGVHVGQDDLAPADARILVGGGAVVGFSTHTVAQFEAALREPVSYVAVGPVFGTATKDTGYDARGLDFVRAASKMAGPVPLVAIGGVTLDNARSAIDAGAAAVAVISDLFAGNDPAARVAAYCRALM